MSNYMYKKMPRGTVLLCHLESRLECAIVPSRFTVDLYVLATIWLWTAGVDNKLGARATIIADLLRKI